MGELSKSDLRKFGLEVGGFALVIGGLSYWRGHLYWPIALWTLGTPLVILGAIAPGMLGPFHHRWMRFGEVARHYNARVILTVLFYFVVTPIGLVLRWFKDPLDRDIADGRSSEWIPRSPQPVDPARYREQF